MASIFLAFSADGINASVLCPPCAFHRNALHIITQIDIKPYEIAFRILGRENGA